MMASIRDLVHGRMMPETAGKPITRESVLVNLGVGGQQALFPCPSDIRPTAEPVNRTSVCNGIDALYAGSQMLCLHGAAGVGKTTALQELEAALPPGSIFVVYDCYGKGRYLDSNASRHRPSDAFLQLSNELASRLRLPIFLTPRKDLNYPRLFFRRLELAAEALAASCPEGLIVIAVDAADNAAMAAAGLQERSFTSDFIQLGKPPPNVRLVITTRTARLEKLDLPPVFSAIEIEPFTRKETEENVTKLWSATKAWLDDFHDLSKGIPRVQAYALAADVQNPDGALSRLLPDGKVLADIFREQFSEALRKNGSKTELTRLCAGLTALPRPVPLAHLAWVTGCEEAHLADICADLYLGIHIEAAAAAFTDEEFEVFVREQGRSELAGIQMRAARRLHDCADNDSYASLNVARALWTAGCREELLALVETETVPRAVSDPVLRREGELERLRLAIRVCREARDVERAIRFLILGAESIKTEERLQTLLADNPDLTARFAPETAGRLILSDTTKVQDHGPFLFHKLTVDADRGDAISYYRASRLIGAWMDAHNAYDRESNLSPRDWPWKVGLAEAVSSVEAALKLRGAEAALEQARRWKPRDVPVRIATSLPYRLISQGRARDVTVLADHDITDPTVALLLIVPLALSGQSVDTARICQCVTEVKSYALPSKSHARRETRSVVRGRVLDALLTACEILAARRSADALVDDVLTAFLDPEVRQVDSFPDDGGSELDRLFRAYTLHEVRAGREPQRVGLFISETEGSGSASRHGEAEPNRKERRLRDIAMATFDLYATAASGLVSIGTKFDKKMRDACDTLRAEIWRLGGMPVAKDICARAAANLVTLLAADRDLTAVMEWAVNIDAMGHPGTPIPSEILIQRLALRNDFHSSLISHIGKAAATIRRMRVPAEEKSSDLIACARLLQPISEEDARAIFNQGIEATNETSRDVVHQIKLLAAFVQRALGALSHSRSMASRIADILEDAALRLDGEDHFPWDRAMGMLASLDLPLALANAARWDDDGTATLWETLLPLLQVGLEQRSVSPVQAAAVSLLVDGQGAVLWTALTLGIESNLPTLPQLAQDVAQDAVIRRLNGHEVEIARCLERAAISGTWPDALLRQTAFIERLQTDSTSKRPYVDEYKKQAREALADFAWARESLIHTLSLQDTEESLWSRFQENRDFLHHEVMFECARRAVMPQDRLAHLDALAGLTNPRIERHAVESILAAVNEWRDSPAVADWCESALPDVIVTHFSALVRHLEYGDASLENALAYTGLSEADQRELLMRGVEQHADLLSGGAVLSLAGMAGRTLTRARSANLVDWYVSRLAQPVAVGHPHSQSAHLIPDDIDGALARFLYAYLGDCDQRLRWRAAHAVRRLARAGSESTIKGIVGLYDNRDERAFRAQGFPFYWLAARLWIVLVCDRIASENPKLVACVGTTLFRIAIDDSFPHMLVRAFARRTCEKLVASGHLDLTPAELSVLAAVNEAHLALKTRSRDDRANTDVADDGYEPRFHFDSLDTIPYWYERIVGYFADVSMPRFLKQADRWIVDTWGHGGDRTPAKEEQRRGRFRERDWSLTMHSHGSIPTIERHDTHLEWHAQWCAAGELLKTESLVSPSPDEDDELLGERVRRELPSSPTLWSADLVVPAPLEARNWQRPTTSAEEWCLAVREGDLRLEILTPDMPGYVVVDGSAERSSRHLRESTQVSSALVEPSAAASLCRALQTMDYWTYKLPWDGERWEIDDHPYRLLGWLTHCESRVDIEEKDPFRAYGLAIGARPGTRVADPLSMTVDGSGNPRWFTCGSTTPMFLYEAFGAPDQRRQEHHHDADWVVSGRRLVVDRQMLLGFLQAQDLDLIVEVKVIREQQYGRRLASEGDTEPEGRFVRIYLLRGNGSLEIAEGPIGAWAGDC